MFARGTAACVQLARSWRDRPAGPDGVGWYGSSKYPQCRALSGCTIRATSIYGTGRFPYGDWSRRIVRIDTHSGALCSDGFPLAEETRAINRHLFFLVALSTLGLTLHSAAPMAE